MPKANRVKIPHPSMQSCYARASLSLRYLGHSPRRRQARAASNRIPQVPDLPDSERSTPHRRPLDPPGRPKPHRVARCVTAGRLCRARGAGAARVCPDALGGRGGLGVRALCPRGSGAAATDAPRDRCVAAHGARGLSARTEVGEGGGRAARHRGGRLPHAARAKPSW